LNCLSFFFTQASFLTIEADTSNFKTKQEEVDRLDVKKLASLAARASGFLLITNNARVVDLMIQCRMVRSIVHSKANVVSLKAHRGKKKKGAISDIDLRD
jgi:hypothetical protein